MTDAFVESLTEPSNQLLDIFKDPYNNLREGINSEVEQVKTIVRKHMDDYIKLLEPVLSEYQAKHDELKISLEPVMKDISAKMVVNVEETRGALKTLMENVRTKVVDAAKSVRDSIVSNPYFAEYKEQFNQAYAQRMNFRQDHLPVLQEKLKPLADKLKDNLEQIFAAVAETMVKN